MPEEDRLAAHEDAHGEEEVAALEEEVVHREAAPQEVREHHHLRRAQRNSLDMNRLNRYMMITDCIS